MNKTKSIFLILVVCAFGIQTAFAQPACEAPRALSEITADLTGLASWDLPSDPDNVVFTVCNPEMADAPVTHVSGAGIVISTVGASWCNEVNLLLNNSLLVTLSGDPFPATPCATVDFADLDISGFGIAADAGGCVTIEVTESFDDVADAIDATIDAGTFTMAGCGAPLVPTLGEWAIISLALLMLIFGVVYMTQKQTELKLAVDQH